MGFTCHSSVVGDKRYVELNVRIDGESERRRPPHVMCLIDGSVSMKRTLGKMCGSDGNVSLGFLMEDVRLAFNRQWGEGCVVSSAVYVHKKSGDTCFPICDKVPSADACTSFMNFKFVKKDRIPLSTWLYDGCLESQSYSKILMVVTNSDAILSLVETGIGNFLAFDALWFGNASGGKRMEQVACGTSNGMFHKVSFLGDVLRFLHSDALAFSKLSYVPFSMSSSCFMVRSNSRRVFPPAKEFLMIHSLYKDTNKIVMQTNAKDDFKFVVGGKLYDVKGVPLLSRNSLDMVRLTYACGMYMGGYRSVAMRAIPNDKRLIDDCLKAFTAKESVAFQKELYDATRSRAFRFLDGKSGDGYIPSIDAPCLWDVFGILLGDNSSMYVPERYYSRISKRTRDNLDVFIADGIADAVPFDKIVVAQDRLNVSIQVMFQGHVHMSPEDASVLGLGENVGARIFRYQTIIKDGAPNMRSLTCIVGKRTASALADLLNGGKGIRYTYDAESGRFVLDLLSLPVITSRYFDSCGWWCGILRDVRAYTEACARQRVYGWLVSRNAPQVASRFPSFAQGMQFDREQRAVLSKYGLDTTFRYVGDAEREDAVDFYYAHNLRFYLKGVESLPSVDDVVRKRKSGAELTLAEKYISDELDDNITCDDFNGRIVGLRIRLALAKLAMVVSGSFDLPTNCFTLLDNGDYLFNNELVVSPRYSKEYV